MAQIRIPQMPEMCELLLKGWTAKDDVDIFACYRYFQKA